MFDRLDQLEARYEEFGRQLSDPKIVNDQENYRKVSKAYRDIEPTVEKFREYRKIKEGIAEATPVLAVTVVVPFKLLNVKAPVALVAVMLLPEIAPVVEIVPEP